MISSTNINKECNKCVPFYYPNSFENRKPSYLNVKYPPMFTWKQGDSVSIPINFDFVQFDFSAYDLSNCSFQLDFYNFRKEIVHTATPNVSIGNGKAELVYNISPEVSQEVFKEGVYYFSLAFITEDERKTLISENECYFYVE